MNYTAVLYTPKLDLSRYLVTENQKMDIFIPVYYFGWEHLSNAQGRVFGSRPYSVASNLIMACVHSGILFPPEKGKKSLRHYLQTAIDCLKFESPSQCLDQADVVIFDEHTNLKGLLVSIQGLSSEPVESCNGFCFPSRSMIYGDFMRFDFLDFYFITPADNMPNLVDVTSYPEKFVNPDTSTKYEPSMLNSGLLMEFLERFNIIFIDGKEKYCMRTSTKNLEWCQISKRRSTNEFKALYSNLVENDIGFDDKCILIKGRSFGPFNYMELSPVKSFV